MDEHVEETEQEIQTCDSDVPENPVEDPWQIQEDYEKEEKDDEERKRLKDPLYCHLCHVQCDTPQALTDHCKDSIHLERSAEEEKERKRNQPAKKPQTEGKKKADTIAEKIRCELCSCECSGDVSYQAHLVGARHQKNLRNKQIGAPLKTGPNKKAASGGGVGENQSSKLQNLLDNSKDPLIGLQYVTEFRDEDPSAEVSYVCNLCDMIANSGNLIPHILGVKHRYNYMKEHYMHYYTIIRQKQCKKSELNPIIDEYAKAIEAEEGRKQIKVKVNLNPFYKKTQEEKKKRVSQAPQPGNQGPKAKRGRMDGWSMGRGGGGGERLSLGGGGGSWGGGFGGPRPFKQLLAEINNADIVSEEDAALALQVSNALTQKLLQYRLQNVPRSKEHVVSQIMGDNWKGQIGRGRGQGQRGGGRGEGRFGRGSYNRNNKYNDPWQNNGMGNDFSGSSMGSRYSSLYDEMADSFDSNFDFTAENIPSRGQFF